MKTAWSSPYMVETIGHGTLRPHYYFLQRKLRKGDSLLEVGCGPGHLLDFLSSKGVGVDYTGADLTDEMLEAFRRRHSGVKTIEVDVQNMEKIGDGSFDWVVCSDVLIHIPDPYSALSHLWRCTRKGLILVLRGSDLPDDIVDIERSFQVTAEGRRYHFNIFSHARMLDRLQNSDPAPVGIDVYREFHLDPLGGGRTIPIDPEQHRIWTVSYAILKDQDRANDFQMGDREFDRRRLAHRAARKLRKLLGRPKAWEID